MSQVYYYPKRLLRPLSRSALVILLFGFTSVPAQQREYRYSVRGRVVDSVGKPVPGAIVYLDPIWAHQIFGATADASGNFHIEESTSVRRKLRRLYVTAPPPSQVAILIRPPYNLLPRLKEKRFAGKQLIMSSKEIDIGDVEVQVRYGVADIRLSNCDGNPLLAEAEEWRYLWFRLRDQSNIPVRESTLSQDDILESVDLPRSTVALALPEGVWRLEVSENGIDGPWVRMSNSLIISTASRPHLTLRACENRR